MAAINSKSPAPSSTGLLKLNGHPLGAIRIFLVWLYPRGDVVLDAVYRGVTAVVWMFIS